MAQTLPFVRRKPRPRHALPDAPRPPAPRRKGDGTTLGILVILVLTSGFVAGTTATFTSSTSNAGNEFSAAALAPPTGLKATPQGSNVLVEWTDAGTYDVLDAGYRISAADWQTAPQPVPTTCTTGSAYVKVNTSASSQLADNNTNVTTNHPNAYVDGRVWCYKAETVYPYPENSLPWLSQAGNPTTVVEVGHTLVSATLGSTAANSNILSPGTGTLASGTDSTDYFELTFNQPIPQAQFPTGYVCVDGSNERVFIGVSNNNATSCPKTGGGADTALRGFAITQDTSVSSGQRGTITPNSVERFAIGTIDTPGCAVSAPPGCFRMRIFLRGRTAGSTTDPTFTSGKWQVQGTNNTSFLTSTGGRSFCQSGGTTTIVSPFVVRANPTTPVAGRCNVTGVVAAF
jgi:hypothetical protein